MGDTDDAPKIGVNVTIREDQREKARDEHLNISSFLREKLDERFCGED